MNEVQWTQKVSKLLDKKFKNMVFESRKKNRKKIHSLHKPLITKKIK